MTTQHPTQPGWGPQQPPAPQPKPKPFYKRTWFIVTAVLVGAGLLGLMVLGTLISAAVDTTPSARVAPTTIDTAPGVPTTEDETADSEPTETSPPDKPPVAKIGQTLTMTDGFGDEVAEITVGGPTSPSGNKGVRFSTGSEFDEPRHGLYMGVWVKVKALADGVDTVAGDLHVSQGGQHYEGDACCPDGFNPTLDYATLSKGETSQGWVVFDIRSKKGEIVIADYDGKRIGAWKF